MGAGWTDELFERAKALAREGISAREIGDQLGGFSKSAVIGKLNRAGIGTSGTAENAGIKRKALKLLPEGTLPPPPVRVTEPRSLPLMRLKSHHCRFPIGDPGTPEFRFCAADRFQDNSSYCEHHHKLAYTSTRSVNLSDQGRAAIRSAQLKRHNATASSGLSLAERMRVSTAGA